MKNRARFTQLLSNLKIGNCLPLLLLILFPSCKKEMDVVPLEPFFEVEHQQQTSYRSATSDEYVKFASWLVTNVQPFTKDEALLDDIRTGNYASARMQTQLAALGFSNYFSFKEAFAIRANAAKSYLQELGTNNWENAEMLLRQSSIDFNVFLDEGHELSGGGTANFPCTEQMYHEMVILMVEVLAVLNADGLEPSLRTATFGLMRLRLAYSDCIKENYPNR